MNELEKLMTRRGLLRGGLTMAAAIALFTPGVFAEHLAATPPLTEGPFYPDHLPLDQDNDLIIVGNSTTPAVGEITQLSGRILDAGGSPVKNVEIEIWQCDANQVYLHSRDSVPKADQRDKNFQGFGRFGVGSSGEYRFRTIKPVPYPGRPAPHIHFKVKKNGRELLTSQIFIAGFPGNKNDGIYRDAGDAFERELVSTDFKPVKDSKIGELYAKFDIIVGRTPADRDEH
jgi:protocatechuate 3,4-dioxygenase beta subunit